MFVFGIQNQQRIFQTVHYSDYTESLELLTVILQKPLPMIYLPIIYLTSLKYFLQR